MSIETEITRIKTNISNAYTKAEEKGATLPEVQNSANLPATIESITGGDDWQPELDWWDIDSIADIDDKDYPAKMILLFNDYYDKLDIYRCNASKIATSDGNEYTGNDDYFTHTWDKSKDKECSLGYKTRYVIFYYNSTGEIVVTGLNQMNKGILYLIVKNFTIKTWDSGNLSGNRTIQAIKLINSSFTNSNFVQSCSNLQKIININSNKKPFYLQNDYTYKTDLTEFDFSLITNLSYAYQNMYNLRKVGRIDTSKISIWNGTFRYDYNLEIIESLDFESATSIYQIFTQCYNLHTIKEIKNIKISGLVFQDCPLSHQSLLNILNALYDYSADTENTYTITLGATNLAKLTAEELAIGQNKNWTIS